MATDTFTPRELIDIAGLAKHVDQFNADQHTSRAILAEVVFYRNGRAIGRLTSDQGDMTDRETGKLVFDPDPEAAE